MKLFTYNNINQLTATCIISFHNEGIWAYTTLTSIVASRIFAEKYGLHIEFVIVLDNHDSCTKNVVCKHPGIRCDDKIEIVHFGDLGLSRNYAISKATCEYIVCMDGDDYYSKNFILNCVQEAARGNNIIAYPEYIFGFGEKFYFAHLAYKLPAQSLSYILFSTHIFCSCITTRRSIFIEHPYKMCTEGFGFEDWHWNCEASSYNLAHSPAKYTVLFYRQKSSSLSKLYHKRTAVIELSNFFATLEKPVYIKRSSCFSLIDKTDTFSCVPNLSIPWKATVKALVFTTLRFLPRAMGEQLYDMLRRWWRKHRKAKSRIFIFNHNDLPNVVQDALFDIAKIDGLLHPDHLPHIQQADIYLDEIPGRAFAAAWHSLPQHSYDIIYTVPQVNTGGADLMTLLYIKAAKAKDKKILCITTGKKPSKLEIFPQSVDILELDKYINMLTIEQKQIIFVRLLLQLQPQVIHAVNDHLSFLCFVHYGKALSSKSRLTASLFCDSIDTDGLEYGSGVLFLRDLYKNISTIIVDNAVTAQNWVKLYGFPENFFQPVYRPIVATDAEFINPVHRNTILWAGRFDAQKRLDIAYEIANIMSDIHFDFSGRNMSGIKNTTLKRLMKLRNVTINGEYDKFSSLPLRKYFCLLYTTQFDGLPNILLEAVSCGLPVIAPDCGGISDFINNKTGWLINNNEDIDTYISAIRHIQSDYNEALIRWKKAKSLLILRHNDVCFKQCLFNVYNW
jgi:glycosyltransferase involved in cell wall biosynthesis